MTTLAPKLPFRHAYAGGYPRLGGQPLPTDADAIDYLDRVAAADGAAVEVGVAQAIDAFVKGCKADNAGYAGDPSRTNWDAIQACCIMAGARTISGALVPLKGTAPTAQGAWTASDYSRGGSAPGMKGNGSSLYLDSNRAGNADGQNDNHLAVYATLATATGNSAYAGCQDSTRFLYEGSATLHTRSCANAYTSASNGNVAGFLAGVRSDAANQTARGGGVQTTTAVASAASGTNTISVFAKGAGTFSAARLSYYSIGSACDLAALDARVSALMRDIQFFFNTGLSAANYNAESVDWANRVYANGGSISASTMSAVSMFCNAIDAAGIRDRFYRLNLFCGNSDASLVAVRTPLYRGPSRTGTQYGNALDTNNNFVQGDYAESGANGGLTNATANKWLNTGFDLSALPSVLVGHLSCYRGPGSEGGVFTRLVMGIRQSAGTNIFELHERSSGSFGFWGGSANASVAGANLAGMRLVSRNSSTDLTLYRQGVSAGTNASSTTPTDPGGSVFVFNSNNGSGSPVSGTFYNSSLRSYSIGLEMTSSQSLAFYDATLTFQNALSRAT